MRTKTKLAIGYLSACVVALIAAGIFLDPDALLLVGATFSALLLFGSICVVFDHFDEVKAIRSERELWEDIADQGRRVRVISRPRKTSAPTQEQRAFVAEMADKLDDFLEGSGRDRSARAEFERLFPRDG